MLQLRQLTAMSTFFQFQEITSSCKHTSQICYWPEPE